MSKKSFILFNDQIEVFDSLSDDDAGKLIKSIYKYANTGKTDTLSGLLKIVFIQFKNGIDRNDEKYEKVCERNKMNIEKRWNNKNTTGISGIPLDTKNTDSNSKSKTDTKTNTKTDTDTDTDTKTKSKRGVIAGKPADTHLIYSQVINCFNKIGVKEDNFKKNKLEFKYPNDEKNKKLIQKWLDKGYTKEDMFDVIYLKYEQWVENDGKNKADMSTFFRPSTILGDKFEEYCQEAKMKEVS